MTREIVAFFAVVLVWVIACAILRRPLARTLRRR